MSTIRVTTQSQGAGRCRRCGAQESPTVTLWASVDLSATVCGDCLHEFNVWADKNPGRAYRDFLPPKHRARRSLLTGHRERVAELEHHMWAAQGAERPPYRGHHAAEPAVKGGAA